MRRLGKSVVFAVLVVASSTLARGHGGGHSSSTVHVQSHTTKSGSFVQSHQRTAPNSTKRDNWSQSGNVNPTTGKPGSKH